MTQCVNHHTTDSLCCCRYNPRVVLTQENSGLQGTSAQWVRGEPWLRDKLWKWQIQLEKWNKGCSQGHSCKGTGVSSTLNQTFLTVTALYTPSHPENGSLAPLKPYRILKWKLRRICSVPKTLPNSNASSFVPQPKDFQKLQTGRTQGKKSKCCPFFVLGLKPNNTKLTGEMPNTVLWLPPSNYCRNTLKTRESYMGLEQNACFVFLECLNYILHPHLLRYKTSTVQRQTAGNDPSLIQDLLFLICHQFHIGSDKKKIRLKYIMALLEHNCFPYFYHFLN